jgi:4-amino-4-deoxy-L-arabinose transferase-like glycosyltransferase
MTRRVERSLLVAVLLAYGALAALYAIRTPDWQAPDEPAHVNYIRQIAENGALPVLEPGDWQQEYQEELTASGFDPALLGRLETVQYEDHQPPLYYLLQAPIYAATGGDLLALRLVSVTLGAGVVLAAWAVLRALFPERPALALTGAAFVAFLPQHLSILGSVSNDPLAELIVGLTLLVAVRYLRGEARGASPALLGELVGLALLTKTTIYFLGGIAVVTVLLRWRRERWPWQVAARQLVAVLVPALILGGVWWARNLSTYGGLDFTGLDRHDEVTVGQPRTAEYIDEVYGGSFGRYLEAFLATTFRSFWGQFGWMALIMPRWAYAAFALFSLGVLAGAALYVRQARWPGALSGPQRDGLVLLALTLGFVLAAYLLYNVTFVQFQGRYLYPALIPLALLVAIGLAGWAQPLPAVARGLAPVVLMFALAAFSLYALEWVITPNLPAW